MILQGDKAILKEFREHLYAPGVKTWQLTIFGISHKAVIYMVNILRKWQSLLSRTSITVETPAMDIRK